MLHLRLLHLRLLHLRVLRLRVLHCVARSRRFELRLSGAERFTHALCGICI